MLSKRQKKHLKSLFSKGEIFFTAPQILPYGEDSSGLKAEPWAVALPRSKEEIVALLSFAQEERIPIIPRGRGTGRAGACVPVGGGIVLSLLGLNRIIEIREKDFVVVVEPGVITGELQRKLSQRKLFYPPDPASADFSTIGGNVATNAGGMQALKYGVTGDYVLGLEAVLPGGKVLSLPSFCHKNVVGLNLSKLFVGSEGTLGVVNKIFLKVLPLPRASLSFLAGFSSLSQLTRSFSLLFQEGILPAALEIIDKSSLEAVSKVYTLPWQKEVEGVLLGKLLGEEEALGKEARLIKDIFQADYFALARGQEEAELWKIRKNISPAAFRLRPKKLSEDFTVPRGKIGEFLSLLREQEQKYSLPILAFGHVGDGNIHTNIMYEPGKEEGKAREVYYLLLEKTLELGGTLSGEHGLGISKRKFISKQIDAETLTIMQEVKKVFDPFNILNPGKAF